MVNNQYIIVEYTLDNYIECEYIGNDGLWRVWSFRGYYIDPRKVTNIDDRIIQLH